VKIKSAMKKLSYILFVIIFIAYISNNIFPYCFEIGDSISMSETKEAKSEKESEKDIENKEQKCEAIISHPFSPIDFYLPFCFTNFYFTPHSFPLSLKSLHDKEIPSPPPDSQLLV
jgi:hypothetical protein